MDVISVLRGILGIIVILGIAFLFSNNKKNIKLRPVLGGIGTLFVFAFLVLGTSVGQKVLSVVVDGVNALMEFASEGINFLFGGLYTEESGIGFVVAFNVLPYIIFFAGLMAVLYHLGAMQILTRYLGGAIAKLLGTSRTESLSAASNIFVGHTEAPLTVRPYLSRMTGSELFAVMVGGLASVAGTMLAAYIALGVPSRYIIAAMFMAAPSGIVMAKMFYPQTEQITGNGDIADHATAAETYGASNAQGDVEVEKVYTTDSGRRTETRSAVKADAVKSEGAEDDDERAANVVDAAASGAKRGLDLALTVGAILLTFVALIAVVNGVLGYVSGWFGVDLSLQQILGYVLAPLAFAMGVPWDEALTVGSFIGEKFILTEFIAYSSFVEVQDTLSPKTVAIVSFALCGFANLASMGSMMGVLGNLAPSRKHEIAKMALPAVFAGMLASMLSASIAGMFI
ncbi:NupC/NupG family nucleoside CNT transporter [Arthrobacter castelli]|uniref:NupC/NupG family nucleoside CNT transporter n=1 Tax=Arthrobacter castelli TaxID=271431 RepID=UPI00040EF727|nr:nucleoside transporter C-terminal domain-containing protein [Arthrobacter castelli]